LDRLGIKSCVTAGCYEAALGVDFDAKPAEIHRAHIRLMAVHRDALETRELINLAKIRLIRETPIEKGRRWIRIGQKERALDVMTCALENDGEADDYLLTGQILEQLWRIEAALPYFEKAVAIRGDAGDRLWLGMALENLNQWDEALSQYKKAVRMRGSAEDYLAKGRLLKQMGHLNQAKACLEQAYKLGDRITSLLLLQEINGQESRARFKKVVTAISGFLSVKNK
jgi:tetratricopeptide (TPR) repeat protein